MIDPKDREALVAYLDGELEPGESAALEQRLAGESELSAELESLRATDALLDLYPAPDLDVDLTPKVLARARRPGRLVRLAPFAALAASLLVVAILLFGVGRGEPEPSPMPATPSLELAIENLHVLEYMEFLDQAGGDDAVLLEDVELLMSLQEEELLVAR